jgi:predicted lipoprotein with Yx(FWY)xxD motif
MIINASAPGLPQAVVKAIEDNNHHEAEALADYTAATAAADAIAAEIAAAKDSTELKALKTKQAKQSSIVYDAGTKLLEIAKDKSKLSAIVAACDAELPSLTAATDAICKEIREIVDRYGLRVSDVEIAESMAARQLRNEADRLARLKSLVIGYATNGAIYSVDSRVVSVVNVAAIEKALAALRE